MAQVFIEYCSGNGEWIAAKAKEAPEFQWIAVEKRKDRAYKIMKRIDREGLSNLRVICSEAFIFTKNELLNCQVDGIFINFPDPWPKRRHAKHRLIQPPFIAELARILKEGSLLSFVSDDEEYVRQASALFLQHPAFKLIPHEEVEYGTSFFERLWREKGRRIYRLRFEKCAP